MLTIILTLFILTQITQGYIHKCGEEINVKEGEKRNIKFWVEEGELLKIDAIKKRQKLAEEESIFEEEINKKHPFIKQHIAILNRLRDNELTKRIGLVPTSDVKESEIVPQVKQNLNKVTNKKDDKTTTTSREQQHSIQRTHGSKVKSVKQRVNLSIIDVKADEEILKIIKQKERQQIAKNDPVLKLTLSKQKKVIEKNKQNVDITGDFHIKTENISTDQLDNKSQNLKNETKYPYKEIPIVKGENLLSNISKGVTIENQTDSETGLNILDIVDIVNNNQSDKVSNVTELPSKDIPIDEDEKLQDEISTVVTDEKLQDEISTVVKDEKLQDEISTVVKDEKLQDEILTVVTDENQTNSEIELNISDINDKKLDELPSENNVPPKEIPILEDDKLQKDLLEEVTNENQTKSEKETNIQDISNPINDDKSLMKSNLSAVNVQTLEEELPEIISKIITTETKMDNKTDSDIEAIIPDVIIDSSYNQLDKAQNESKLSSINKAEIENETLGDKISETAIDDRTVPETETTVSSVFHAVNDNQTDKLHNESKHPSKEIPVFEEEKLSDTISKTVINDTGIGNITDSKTVPDIEDNFDTFINNQTDKLSTQSKLHSVAPMLKLEKIPNTISKLVINVTDFEIDSSSKQDVNLSVEQTGKLDSNVSGENISPPDTDFLEKINEFDKELVSDDNHTQSVQISLGILETLKKYFTRNREENITKEIEPLVIEEQLETIGHNKTNILENNTISDNTLSDEKDVISKELLNTTDKSTNKSDIHNNSDVLIDKITTVPSKETPVFKDENIIETSSDSNLMNNSTIIVTTGNNSDPIKFDDLTDFITDETTTNHPIPSITDIEGIIDGSVVPEINFPSSTKLETITDTVSEIKTINKKPENQKDLTIENSLSLMSDVTSLDNSAIEITANTYTNKDSKPKIQSHIFDVIATKANIEVPPLQEPDSLNHSSISDASPSNPSLFDSSPNKTMTDIIATTESALEIVIDITTDLVHSTEEGTKTASIEPTKTVLANIATREMNNESSSITIPAKTDIESSNDSKEDKYLEEAVTVISESKYIIDSERSHPENMLNDTLSQSKNDTIGTVSLYNITNNVTKLNTVSDNLDIKSEIINTNEELFEDFIKVKIDKMSKQKQKEEIISDSLETEGHLFGDKPGMNLVKDGSSIRDLHKEFVDVKPELFEIRNVIKQISNQDIKNEVQSSKSEIDQELLTAINDYPKTIDSAIPKNNKEDDGEGEMKTSNNLQHKISKKPIKVLDQVEISLSSSSKEALPLSNNSVISNQSNIDGENGSADPNELNASDKESLNNVKDVDKIQQDNKHFDVPDNTLVTINIETKDQQMFDEFDLKLTDGVDKEIHESDSLGFDVLTKSNNVPEVNIEQPDIIIIKVLDEHKEEKTQQKLIKEKTNEDETDDMYGIEIESEKENIKSNSKDSSEIQVGNNGSNDDDSPIFQMIPHEVLNFEILDDKEEKKENSIVIKETGIKVSIATPSKNVTNSKENETMLTKTIPTKETPTKDNKITISTTIEQHKENSPVVKIEGHQKDDSNSKGETDIYGHKYKDSEFVYTSDNVKDLKTIEQTDPQKESHKPSKVENDIELDGNMVPLENIRQAVKLPLKLKDTSIPVDDESEAIPLSDDTTKHISNRFDNLPGYVSNFSEISVEEENSAPQTTTVKSILDANVPNDFTELIIETSTNIINENDLLQEMNGIQNVSQNPDIPSEMEIRQEYLSGHDEIDDFINPTLTDLKNDFDLPFVSDDTSYVVDDLIETNEETTTSENISTDAKHDKLSAFLHEFNRPSVSEKRENVIDMIKDFIFSIPQYSKSKDDEISPVNFSKNDHLEEIQLEDGDFITDESVTNSQNQLKSKEIYPSQNLDYPLVDADETFLPQTSTDQLQKRTGPDHSFDSYWKDIQSRRDDTPTYYGGDNPFFIKLPGSPNTVPVFLQYEPVQVKYVPAEKMKKSGINEDLISKRKNETKSNFNPSNYSSNSPNYIKPNIQSDDPDPFFIMDSPNLSNINVGERIPQTELNKEIFIDMQGKLSIGGKTKPVSQIYPDQNEILYPGKISDVEAYSSIDTQSLSNLVFQMGPKFATPRTREPNPQYTPFPLTTNPPLTSKTKPAEGSQSLLHIGNEFNTSPASVKVIATAEYSPVPSTNFHDTADETTPSYNGQLKIEENTLLSRDNNYRYPQRSALYEANSDKFPHPTRQTEDEDFDVVALANFLHQSQKGWIDKKPLALPTVGSWRGSSWDHFKYVSEDDQESWQPTKNSSPWLKNEKDSKQVYGAFYSPEDIPGIDPALFSYRKNVPTLRQSRKLDLQSLKTYINNLPIPLREAVLSPPPKSNRTRRHAFLGEQIKCEWNIQSDANLYLVVTFHNMSAEFSVNCEGAYIEIERENNGFDARWCGNRVSMDNKRSHVIFAKSHIRVGVYDNGDGVKQIPTGFAADVEAIDLSNTDEYAKLALSNARTHMRKMRLAARA